MFFAFNITMSPIWISGWGIACQSQYFVMASLICLRVVHAFSSTVFIQCVYLGACGFWPCLAFIHSVCGWNPVFAKRGLLYVHLLENYGRCIRLTVVPDTRRLGQSWRSYEGNLPALGWFFWSDAPFVCDISYGAINILRTREYTKPDRW